MQITGVAGSAFLCNSVSNGVSDKGIDIGPSYKKKFSFVFVFCSLFETQPPQYVLEIPLDVQSDGGHHFQIQDQTHFLSVSFSLIICLLSMSLCSFVSVYLSVYFLLR